MVFLTTRHLAVPEEEEEVFKLRLCATFPTCRKALLFTTLHFNYFFPGAFPIRNNSNSQIWILRKLYYSFVVSLS